METIVLCLILDSRQNRGTGDGTKEYIVLCLILDSRQNCEFIFLHNILIVLCLILDSRQNFPLAALRHAQLYCALFWIQGKTAGAHLTIGFHCTVPYFGFKAKHIIRFITRQTHCTVPYFGFKAKLMPNRNPVFLIVLCLILDSRQNLPLMTISGGPIVLCLILDSRQNLPLMTISGGPLYCALFWIQGKTNAIVNPVPHDCTVPYFGFKAKLQLQPGARFANCTVPYFGFKAKPLSIPPGN